MSSVDIQTSFLTNYRIDVLDEIPPGEDVRFFPPSDQEGGKNGLLVAVEPDSAPPWIGLFGKGYPDPVAYTGIVALPSADDVAVISAGSGTVVNAGAPDVFERIALFPITRALPIPSQGIVVISDFTRICAWGSDGAAWTTGRLAYDSLDIHSVKDGKLIGTAWDASAGADIPFEIDLRSGTVAGGAELPTSMQNGDA